MGNEEQGHRRRVRYQGTHPKKFGEKYKELAPEKYADTVAKILQKGNTPAGMHIPICVNEILEFLQVKPGQTGLDATLGYGGHTSELLKRLDGKGHLYALDIDPIEIIKTRQRLERMGYGPEILTVKQLNFAEIDQLADEMGPVDFVLADLGVSSMATKLRAARLLIYSAAALKEEHAPYGMVVSLRKRYGAPLAAG